MFKSREDIKEWITNYIKNSGKMSLHIAINNSEIIKKSIIEFTNFLPIDTKFNQRCFHIMNDIHDIPICKECGENRVNFNSFELIFEI